MRKGKLLWGTITSDKNTEVINNCWECHRNESILLCFKCRVSPRVKVLTACTHTHTHTHTHAHTHAHTLRNSRPSFALLTVQQKSWETKESSLPSFSTGILENLPMLGQLNILDESDWFQFLYLMRERDFLRFKIRVL